MDQEIPSKKTLFSKESGQRIDNFLFSKFRGVPKSMIYRFLRQGKIRINEKRIKPKYRLIIGDEISIPPIKIVEYKNVVFPNLKKVSSLSKSILYEDGHILVLNKPSGIAVHGGSGLNFGIIEGLRSLRPNENFLELVHRLDRETSGVLLIAKKRSALRLLHRQLRERKIKKYYLTLVQGYWKSNLKLIRAPLVKNILKNGERIVQVSPEGKPSETSFQVKERYAFTTLLGCKPLTGRTHQIRVHTQNAGHPIIFDNRYGNPCFNKKMKEIGFSRLFLHAKKLQFIHPYTNKDICIEAPLDENLKKCLEILRNKNA